MREPARPQRHPRRAAHRRRRIVLLEARAPLQQVLLHERHVVQRRQVHVLVVRQHEHDVGLPPPLRLWLWRRPATRAGQRRLILCSVRVRLGGNDAERCGVQEGGYSGEAHFDFLVR